MRTYSELAQLTSFDDRLRYLLLKGCVGRETFGYERYLNQKFYSTREWKDFRRSIIIRDCGNDLGVDGYPIINEPIYIHHLNVITIDDIVDRSDKLLDPENAICCRFSTHQAIHYCDDSVLFNDMIIRTPNDTAPWRI